jgi:hypothetical protein
MADLNKVVDADKMENNNPASLINSVIPSKNYQPEMTQSSDYGLTVEEEKDPNKIKVVIADPSQVIVLFGAKTSGKTMTLVRLTRYLRRQGYKVEPDRIFRPSDSIHYKTMCDEFNKTISSDYPPEGTQIINFMLVKIMNKYGEPICQILEAPGEHYFDDKKPNKPFPRYINEICNIDNPKTWVFIVEREWKDPQDRLNYAQKITEMQGQLGPKDKIIFTCHKADKHKSLFIDKLHPNKKQFFKDIDRQYPGIFKNYINENPITRLWRKYNFNFVVFTAGEFNDFADGGGQSYVQSNDKYPAELWQTIYRTVKGGF